MQHPRTEQRRFSHSCIWPLVPRASPIQQQRKVLRDHVPVGKDDDQVALKLDLERLREHRRAREQAREHGVDGNDELARDVPFLS